MAPNYIQVLLGSVGYVRLCFQKQRAVLVPICKWYGLGFLKIQPRKDRRSEAFPRHQSIHCVRI